MAFSASYVANDEVGRLFAAFVDAIRAGDVRWQPAAQIVDYMRSGWPRLRIWGWMGVGLPPLALLAVIRSRRVRHPYASVIAVGGLVSGLFPLLMFYIAGYSQGYDAGFLGVSFDRAMFPAAVLLFWSVIAFGAARIPSGSDRHPTEQLGQ